MSKRRDRPFNLQALPELVLQLLMMNEPPSFFTPNSAPTVLQRLEWRDRQIIPQVLSKLVGLLFRRN
jgi:hypothetical protein